MKEPFLVFATKPYQFWAKALSKNQEMTAGELQRVPFPDGESYHRLTSRIRGRDVVVVGGTISDEATMELYDLACGLVAEGARSLMMVVPYFGYSTMERAGREGEIVKAKNRANLISSIPKARICNEILLIDLHTLGTTHYFEGHLHPYHLAGMETVATLIKDLGTLENVVLASTDAGRAKWVEALANHLGVPAAFVYKQRLSGNKTEIRGVNADVADRTVVIYDDMIRTGGSLINAAKAYKDVGAKSIIAVSTHGVLPGQALSRIHDSGLFDQLFVSDTHPNALDLAEIYRDGWYQTFSMIPATHHFLRHLYR